MSDVINNIHTLKSKKKTLLTRSSADKLRKLISKQIDYDDQNKELMYKQCGTLAEIIEYDLKETEETDESGESEHNLNRNDGTIEHTIIGN